jgi:hypothetical protein
MRVPHTLAAAAVLMLASQAPALAQAVGCTNATLSGEYAVHGQGWVGSAEPFSPEVVVGTRWFDGKGSLTGGGHQSIAGVSHWFKVTGTYSVATDCAVTIDATATVTGTTKSTMGQWFGVAVDAGNRIFVSRTDSGATTSTEFDRVVPLY